MNKCSQLLHKFTDQDYVFGEVNGYRIPLSKNNENPEKQNFIQLALCDITAMNRIGIRGSNIVQWLEEQHNILVPAINHAIITQDGLLVVRMSCTEFLILEDIEDHQNSFEKLAGEMEYEPISKEYPEIYYLPRQNSHSCFMISGEQCAALFSKLCAVDFRVQKFANMRVAQTPLARTNVIIIRRDISDISSYFILMDSSLTEYIWDCLVDAMLEFDGHVVAYDTIKKIN